MKVKHFMRRGMGVLLAAAMVFTAMPDTYVYAAKEKAAAEEALESGRTQDTERGQETEKVSEAEGILEPEGAPEKPEIPETEEEVSVYRLVKKGEPSEYGYQEMVWVDENGNEVEGESAYEQPGQRRRRARISLPSSYSMEDQGELPPVRSQGKWGTCWAHAALCSLETNMVKKGLKNAEDVDYSERHLAYFSHRRNEALGDGVDDKWPEYGWYGGGNYYDVIGTLGGWSGAAAERDYPYSSYDDMEDLEESHRNSSVCHLTDANILNTPEDIKRAIMNTGSVMCSYYAGGVGSEVRVYHAEEHSTNHAVSIVGWDDHYSWTNFDDNGRQPANDGAWRCRNSWDSDWGEEGYFWISYEDVTIKNFCTFEGETADNYDHNYTYNGSMWEGDFAAISYEKSANIFCTQSVEELRAVSFYAYRNYDYVVEIYIEGENGMSSPSEGALVYSQEGSLEHPGYHTIPLDNTALLDSGKKFAVSVQFMSKDTNSARTYVESRAKFNSLPIYSSEAGQSFLYTNTGWKDTQDVGYNNVYINALTDTVRPADKSELQSLIGEAEQLAESDYTTDSWAHLQAELEKAKEIEQSADATRHEVAQAVRNLKSAKESLVPADYVEVIDKSELLSLIEGAEQLVESDYTADSWENLQTELEKAREVYQLTNATNSEVAQAVQNLKSAKESLVSIPVYIRNVEEFEAFARSVTGKNNYEGKTIYLMNDLDMTGIVHTRIGTSSTPFMGTFDGGGHTITNLTYEYQYSYGGLFGYIGERGIAKNIKLANAKFNLKSSYSGGIAGENKGTIAECMLTNVEIISTATAYTGGIAAVNQGTIAGCGVEGSLSFEGSVSGGIVGYNKGIIEQSSVKGTMTFLNQGTYCNCVGGIAGNNLRTVSKCFVEGEIILDGLFEIGGIVGSSFGTVWMCYNLAAIIGNPTGASKIGGIAASVCNEDAKIYGCYNYGKIECSLEESEKFGAVYGYKSGKGTVVNCYYLDNSSTQAYPSSTQGSMTAEEFASAKAAYYLNSNGGKRANVYEWSQKDGFPVWADDENKAVIKVAVSQAEGNAYQPTLNGIADGEFYAKGGTEVEFQPPNAVQGYNISYDLSGLEPSSRGGNWYVLPETDAEVVITCQRTPIQYGITYHLNKGIGAEDAVYDVETAVTLPIPVRAKAEFLGWYDNEAFNGEAISEIPLGSTGDREFWAKWNHLGYEVIFPEKAGYETAPAEGFVNGKIPEDGSYLFTISAPGGYDLSGVVVKCGSTVLTPSNGVYRIDHILSDIEDISIEGIKLGSGNYTVKTYQGYVGGSAVITPAAPATGIRLAGDTEFSDSITVDTTQEIRVVTCDEEGNVSREERVDFQRDTVNPAIASVEVSAASEETHYKGVYLTVNASDAESGIAEYSFDGGETWQKDNRYYVACEETARNYGKKIQVRDYAGNTAEYTKQITIPAFVKYSSSITLTSEKESYAYGSFLKLKADIIFEDAQDNSTGYGKVKFVTAEGTIIGTVNVEASGRTKGSAEINLSVVQYNSIGVKNFRAVYNGKGTVYADSESDTCRVQVVKALAATVNTSIPASKTVSASEQYTAEQIKALIGISQVEVTTNTGFTRTLPVSWSTEDDYNRKGRTYTYTGTIVGDTYTDVPEDMELSTQIIVTPALLNNPVLPDIEVERGYRTEAGIGILGAQVFPAEGTSTVGGAEVPWQITWDTEKSIDLTRVGNSVEFTGTITYENVPEWVTLPKFPAVSRRVTVKESSKTPVEITGVRPQNGVYNGQPWSGYTGEMASAFSGDYEIFYRGREGTRYSGGDAPVNAGSYTVTIRVPEEDGEYIGSLSLDFEIEKAEVTVTVKDKSVKAGSPVPSLTDAGYTVSGLAEGEALKTLPELRYASAPDMARPGSIAITAGGARVPDGGNYHEEIHYVDGTLSITKQGSAVTVAPEKESYLYGEKIVLTADITFGGEVGRNTSYGEVQFVLSDSVLAGSAAVESLGGRKGRARLVIEASAYENTGEKYYRAMYDGTDTPYDSSISEDCRVEVRKRAIELPVLEDIEMECGKDASAGAGVLGEKVLPRSGTVTVYGTEIPYRITWNPSETIDLTAVGSSVEFTGTVTYENVPEWAEAPENVTVKRRVTVKKSEEDPSGGKPGETPETPPAGQPGTPPGKSETPKPPIRQPETPSPEQPGTPEFKKGAEESTGPGRYRVLDANQKTAVLVEIMNKDAVKMNVPATVKIGGVTCKVVQIGDRVFRDSKKLKKLILGKYVAAIGKEAFMNCKKLKTVELKGNALKKIKPKAFKKTAAKITVIAKKMTKKQKAVLRRNLKKAGISKKVKVK